MKECKYIIITHPVILSFLFYLFFIYHMYTSLHTMGGNISCTYVFETFWTLPSHGLSEKLFYFCSPSYLFLFLFPLLSMAFGLWAPFDHPLRVNGYVLELSFTSFHEVKDATTSPHGRQWLFRLLAFIWVWSSGFMIREKMLQMTNFVAKGPVFADPHASLREYW